MSREVRGSIIVCKVYIIYGEFFAVQSGDVMMMPVPSSYNDISTDSSLRDFVGWAWYDTEFFVSKDWLNSKRIFLRFGSAHYNAIVVSIRRIHAIVHISAANYRLQLKKTFTG